LPDHRAEGRQTQLPEPLKKKGRRSHRGAKFATRHDFPSARSREVEATQKGKKGGNGGN